MWTPTNVSSLQCLQNFSLCTQSVPSTERMTLVGLTEGGRRGLPETGWRDNTIEQMDGWTDEMLCIPSINHAEQKVVGISITHR